MFIISQLGTVAGVSPLIWTLGQSHIAIKARDPETRKIAIGLFARDDPTTLEQWLPPLGQVSTISIDKEHLYYCNENGVYRSSYDGSNAQLLKPIRASSLVLEKQWLAILENERLFAMNLDSNQLICFDGHLQTIHQCVFIKQWIITTSLDKTFKVWDPIGKECTYQSCIFASPILTVAVDPLRFCFAIGFENGTVQIYECTPRSTKLGIEPRLLKTLNITFLKNKESTEEEPDVVYVTSFPAWKTFQESVTEKQEQVQTSPSILYLGYVDHGLLVGCRQGYLLIHSLNYETLETFEFVQHNLPFADDYYLDDNVLGVAHKMTSSLSFFNISRQKRSLVKFDSEASLIDNVKQVIQDQMPESKWSDNLYKDCMKELTRLEIFEPKDVQEKVDALKETQLPPYVKDLLLDSIQEKEIDFFPDCPERFPLQKKAPKTPVKPKGKPVTFRSTVKSSGYLSAPVMTLFGKSSKPKKTRKPLPAQEYVETGPLIEPTQNPKISHRSTITYCKYHPSGKYFATCSVDKTARYYKTPLIKSEPKDFIGHNTAICHLSWSLNPSPVGVLLSTSSTDGQVRIWSIERSDPCLVFSGLKSPTSTQKLSNYQRQTRFFYKDSLLVLNNQSSLCLYDIHIEPAKDSVKPLLNYNSYRLVHSLESKSSQSITSHNGFNCHSSPLLLCGTSDRKLLIWDTLTQQCIRNIDNVHTRAIHEIALADYQTPNPSLFATTSIMDGIKLWDIRTPKVVMQLNGHVNRSLHTMLSISPCFKYLGTGSEDHHGYLFDLRTGLLAGKTRLNHGDSVLCLDFHPKKPELATSSKNGISLFSS